jgi:hypothetical protein
MTFKIIIASMIMRLTTKQSNLISDLRSGISHLKATYPEKKKFKLKEVLCAAGHEDGQIKLYQLLKSFARKRDIENIKAIHSLFSSVNVDVKPLRSIMENIEFNSGEVKTESVDFKKKKKGKIEIEKLDISIEENESVDIAGLADDDYSQADQTQSTAIQVLEKSDEMFNNDLETYRPSLLKEDRIVMPQHHKKDEIHCLAEILHLLATFSQQKRSSILASAESFYQIGM